MHYTCKAGHFPITILSYLACQRLEMYFLKRDKAEKDQSKEHPFKNKTKQTNKQKQKTKKEKKRKKEKKALSCV